jgi:hypothetical protein
MLLKVPSRDACVERFKVLLRERGKAQALGVGPQNFLIKRKKCFVKMYICN